MPLKPGLLKRKPMKGRRKPVGKGRRNSPRIPKEPTGPEPLASLCRRVDRLAAAWCKRGGSCLLAGLDGIECVAPLDAAHVIKRTKGHIRHLPENLLPVCRAHHDHYESRLDAWREIVMRVTGNAFYFILLHNVLNKRKAQCGDDLRSVYLLEERRYSMLLTLPTSDDDPCIEFEVQG